VAWAPLLLAAPVLAAALAVTVVAAGVSATRARSVIAPPARRVRAIRWAFTTFLYLIQPLARTRGRLWGGGPVRSRAARFAAPLPRVLGQWSESWQSAEKRLSDIETRLRCAGAIVRRGGTYDRWDLQARYGLRGAVRIRIGIEEHGAGRQLVRLHLMPLYSRGAAGLIALLAALAVGAILDGAALAASVLLAACTLLSLRAIRSAGLTMGSVLLQLRAGEHAEPATRRAVSRMRLETHEVQ
jgi:hypothetical protein